MPSIFQFLDKLTSKAHNDLLQEELLEHVNQEVQFNLTYFLLLVSSTIIATLGLLTNSGAVVIGAMLISPLFWPLLGVTMSLVTPKGHFTKRSLTSLIISLLLVVIISYLIARVIPLTNVPEEILSRTAPNLLHLFIALVTSSIGVLAVYNPRISSTATGAAISIALLPPLSVFGIGLALNDQSIFLGASLLFGANMAAMIFAGIITLYLLHFTPKKDEEQNRFGLGFLVSSIMLIALSVPLLYFLDDSLTKSSLEKMLSTSTIQEIQSLSSNAQVESVTIHFPTKIQDQQVNIQSTVYLPEGETFTTAQQQGVINRLSQLAQRNVDLRLNLVNTLHLIKQEDRDSRDQKAKISSLVTTELQSFLESSNIQTLLINIGPLNSDSPLQISVDLRYLGTLPLTFQQKEQIRHILESKLGMSIDLTITVTPVTSITAPSPNQNIQVQLDQAITTELSNLLYAFPGQDFTFKLQSVVATTENIDAVVILNLSELLNFTLEEKLLLESHLAQQFGKNVSLNFQISQFTSL